MFSDVIILIIIVIFLTIITKYIFENNKFWLLLNVI